jgi:arabinosaccharide transport system substrate-binding protein
MKCFKKVVVGLLLMALVAGSMFASGKQEASPNEVTKTKLDMWVFVELHGKFYKEMVEEWNVLHPDRQIELNVTALPADDLHSKLQMSLQAGTGAPDLVDVLILRFPTFLKGTPQFLTLNNYIEPYLGNVVKSRLDVYSKNGNMYGVPTHVGASVMYYNVEILEAAGVDYKKIITWDDYIEAGKIVKNKTGKTMYTIETDRPYILSAFLAQQGSDFVTDDGKPNVNTPEMYRALEIQNRMKNLGIAEVAPGGRPDVEEAYGWINAGQVASLIHPMWYMSRFVDYMPDLKGKIAIAPIPVFEEGMPRSAGIGGTGTVVPLSSKNKDLAAEWLTWAKLSETGNRKIWEILGFDPVNTKTWTDPELINDSNNEYIQYFVTNPFDVLDEIKDEIALVRSVEASPTINTIFNTQVQYDVFEFNKDIKEVLKNAQTQLENELR